MQSKQESAGLLFDNGKRQEVFEFNPALNSQDFRNAVTHHTAINPFINNCSDALDTIVNKSFNHHALENDEFLHAINSSNVNKRLQKNGRYVYPLQIAIHNIDQVKWLVHRLGADVNCKVAGDSDPGYLPPIAAAVERNNLEIVNTLYQQHVIELSFTLNGADANHLPVSFRYNPQQPLNIEEGVCIQSMTAQLHDRVIKNQIDTNFYYNKRPFSQETTISTPLNTAILNCNFDMVQVLLQMGADSNFPSEPPARNAIRRYYKNNNLSEPLRCLPLVSALLTKNIDIAQLLINSQASINNAYDYLYQWCDDHAQQSLDESDKEEKRYYADSKFNLRLREDSNGNGLISREHACNTRIPNVDRCINHYGALRRLEILKSPEDTSAGEIEKDNISKKENKLKLAFVVSIITKHIRQSRSFDRDYIIPSSMFNDAAKMNLLGSKIRLLIDINSALDLGDVRKALKEYLKAIPNKKGLFSDSEEITQLKNALKECVKSDYVEQIDSDLNQCIRSLRFKDLQLPLDDTIKQLYFPTANKKRSESPLSFFNSSLPQSQQEEKYASGKTNGL